MNYEKGEPSVFSQKRKISDNLSLSSCYLPFYKSRRPDERRRISRSPEQSKRCSLEDRDLASRRHGTKMQRSVPRYSESDLCLQEVQKRKRKDFFTTSMLDSNMQKSYHDYHFDIDEHGNLMGHKRRPETPGGSSRSLGAKHQSVKEIQVNISTFKPLDLRSEMRKHLKSSKQSPHVREADNDIRTNHSHSEPFCSERSVSRKLCGVKIKAPSRHVFSFGEFSSSGLEKKGSKNEIQEQDVLEQAGLKYRRSNIDNTIKVCERDQDSENQSNFQGKYNGYSEEFYKAADDAVLWTAGPDPYHTYVDPRRKKRRIRNSNNKYDAVLPDRRLRDQNMGLGYSGKQITCVKKSGRSYPSHEPWVEQPIASEYEYRNSFGDIQCKDKNFSYSHNLTDSKGFLTSPARENKHLWEQTIVEESTVSMEKPTEHSSYPEDETQDDSSLETSGSRNSPRKQLSWRRYEKATRMHIPYPVQATRANECTINQWTRKTKQRQCSSSHKEVWDNCEKQADETSVPGPEHLNEDNDIVLVPFWTSTKWMGEVCKENIEESKEAQWAYEVYSNTCQKSSEEQAITGGKYENYTKPLKGDFENDNFVAKQQDRSWKNSGDSYCNPCLNNFRVLAHDRSNTESKLYSNFDNKQIWKMPHRQDTWLGYSELRCSEESVNEICCNTQSSNSRECLLNTDTTSELASERDIKKCNFQEQGTITRKAKAVQTSFINSKLNTNQQGKETFPQVTEECKKLSEIQNVCVNLGNSEQCRFTDPLSRQTQCSVDEKLIRTVHSIKDDIESVLQMLNSLEVQEENIDMKASVPLNGNLFDKTVPSEQLDTIANVSCATDFVKRAFEKLVSFKNTFVIESTEDDDTNSQSYEEYKKGKDDYIATKQDEAEPYDVETISYYKSNRQNSTENRGDEEDQVAKHYSDKSKRGKSDSCNGSSPVVKDGNDVHRKNRRRKNSLQEGVNQKNVESESDSYKQAVSRNVEMPIPLDFRGKDRSKKQHMEKPEKKSLPEIVSNELKHGSMVVPNVSTGESDSQPPTKQGRKRRKGSHSPKKEKTVFFEHDNYMNGTYPPPTFIGGKEKIHRNKPHKRRKKVNVSEKIKNPSPQEKLPSVPEDRYRPLGDGSVSMQRPADVADSLLEDELMKQHKKSNLSVEFENDTTDRLKKLARIARSKEDRTQITKLTLEEEDNNTATPDLSKNVLTTGQNEIRTSPSPKSKRIKVISEEFVITPTPNKKSTELSEPPVIEHQEVFSMRSMKEKAQDELHYNEHVFVSEGTDTETRSISSTGQSTNIQVPTTLEAHNLSPDQRSKKSSFRKRSSRNRINKRKKNTFIFDKYGSDSTKVASSDINPVKNSLEKTRDKVYQRIYVSEIPSETLETNSTSNKSELQEFSNDQTVSGSNSERTPSKKSNIPSETENPDEDLSTRGKNDFGICFNSANNSNEQMACALSEQYEHAIAKRHIKANSTTKVENLAKKTDNPPPSKIIQENQHPQTPNQPPLIIIKENKLRKIRKPSEEVSASELNVSIKKLYEEINKLRLQLEAAAEEIATHPVPSVDELEHSYKYARSYKVFSSLRGNTPDAPSVLGNITIQDSRKSTSNISTKKANSPGQGDDGSKISSSKEIIKGTKKEQQNKSQKNKAQQNKTQHNKTQQNKTQQKKTQQIKTQPNRKHPVPTSMSEIQNDNDEDYNYQANSSGYNKTNRLIPEEICPNKTSSLSSLDGVPKDCADLRLNATCNRNTPSNAVCITENTLSGKNDNKYATWANDDAYVTATCEMSDKTDTQQTDATDKFLTALSGNDESTDPSCTRTGRDRNNMAQQVSSPHPFECDTTGRNMRTPDAKHVYTVVSSPEKLLADTPASRTSTMETAHDYDKQAEDNTLSGSNSQNNQVDETKINTAAHESMNNNTRDGSFNVWPKVHGSSQQSPISYMAVKSVTSHHRSVTLHEDNTREINREINYQEKFYTQAGSSKKCKPDNFLEMCSEIRLRANDVEVDSKKNTNEPSKPWSSSPVYPPWNELCTPAEQNTSQNKGSPKEGFIAENISFQRQPPDLRPSENIVSQNEKGSLCTNSFPLFIKCVKDVLLGSTKIEAKEITNKNPKMHACPARNKLSSRKYSDKWQVKTSNLEHTVEPSSEVDEVYIGGYINARKRVQCHAMPKQSETFLESAPVIDNYVFKKKRQLGGDAAPFSTKFFGNSEEKNYSIYDRQITWKNQGLDEKPLISRDVVVNCGLNRKNVSLISQNSPMHIKAAHVFKSYLPTPEQDMETDRVRSHYSDAINTKSGKFFTRSGISRLNVSSVSRSHDSNTGRHESDFSASDKDCSDFYEEMTNNEHGKPSILEKSDLNEYFENARKYQHRPDCFPRNEVLNPLNRRPPPDENVIIATFESMMQQKRPYYVEHCGKKKDRIVVDQCVNTKVMQDEINMEPREMNSAKSNFNIVTVADDNNSSIEMKSVRVSTDPYMGECSESSDLCDKSDVASSELKKGDENGDNLDDKGDYRVDDYQDDVEDEDETTSKMIDDGESQPVDEILEMDEDKTEIEEEEDNDDDDGGNTSDDGDNDDGESQQGYEILEEDEDKTEIEEEEDNDDDDGENNDNEVMSRHSSLDTDELESWYKPTDEESLSYFISEENNQEEEEEQCYDEGGYYLDNEEDESEDDDCGDEA